MDPAIFAKALTLYVGYYLATRPLARQLDPILVRQACAETLLAAERSGDLSRLLAAQRIPLPQPRDLAQPH